MIRCGVFEVDLQAAELRKNGVKVKLQEQPFQILSLLLERPGKVVTRDEIQHKLWSEDTFVDFEHSLNAAEAARAGLYWQGLAGLGPRHSRHPALVTATAPPVPL